MEKTQSSRGSGAPEFAKVRMTSPSVAVGMPAGDEDGGLPANEMMLIVLAACMVTMGLLGIGKVLTGGPLWLVEVSLLLGITATIGWAVCRRPAGILIGPQKIMSLSRFQMVLWTHIILSAYVTIVLGRMGTADPLAVTMDSNWLPLMVISTTSLMGSLLIQKTKHAETAQQGTAERAAANLGQRPEQVAANATGLLYGNSSMHEATFFDMFRGDEVGNAHVVDLYKVQMFICTFVCALIYSVKLYVLIDQTPATSITTLPSLSPGLLSLLAFSHAGYLGGKLIRQTPVAGDTAIVSSDSAASTARVEPTSHLIVETMQNSQEMMRAIQRSTSSQSRNISNLADTISKLVENTGMQARSGRSISDSIDQLTETLDGLHHLAKAQMRSGDRILDVVRKLEDLARDQNQVRKR